MCLSSTRVISSLKEGTVSFLYFMCFSHSQVFNKFSFFKDMMQLVKIIKLYYRKIIRD